MKLSWLHTASLASIPLLLAAGCSQPTLPFLGTLAGQWEWQFNANPAGSRISLSLSTDGADVSGTGTVCGVGPNCAPGAVTITGQSDIRSFHLTIRAVSGFVATYEGQFVGPNELKGTWAEGTDSGSSIFYRR
jgi:hypothetical protein